MTTKRHILNAIRANCLECMGGYRDEVRLCASYECNLYPYRMGKDPNPARRVRQTPQLTPGAEV